MGGLNIDSWQDVLTLASVFGAVCAALGVIGTQFYNRLHAAQESQAADDAASERLIALIEREADKRVEIVRTEFKLKLAELKLEHQAELTAVRSDFDKQVRELRSENDTYRCDNAPSCEQRLRTKVAASG